MFFNTPAEEEASNNYEPLPNGIYRVMLDNSEGKVSQAGDPYISLTMLVVDEQYKGRKIWHNFNLQSRSAQAQQIARGQFKNLLLALNHTAPLEYENDFHRLVMAKPVIEIELGQRLNKQSNQLQNTVKTFTPKKSPGSSSGSAGQRSQGSYTQQQGLSQQSAAKGSPVAPPWSQDDVPPF